MRRQLAALALLTLGFIQASPSWGQLPLVEQYTAQGKTFSFTPRYDRISVDLAEAQAPEALVASLMARPGLRQRMPALELRASEQQPRSGREVKRVYLEINGAGAGAITPDQGRSLIDALRAEPTVSAAHPAYEIEGELVYLTGDLMVSVAGAQRDLPAALTREIAAEGGQVVGVYPMGDRTSVQVRYPGNHRLFETTRAMNGRVDLRYAEPEFEFTCYSPALVAPPSGRSVPNDPDFAIQLFLDNPTDKDIDAPEAWALTQGSSQVYVAIFDVGFDIDHPDVVAKVNTSLAIDPTSTTQPYPLPLPQNPAANHGTPCMGLVAAQTNNNLGVAGVGYNVRPLPVNIGTNPRTNGTFTATAATFARAASFLISSGATVVAISNSFSSGFGSDMTFRDAYASMQTQTRGGMGAVILASTGNSSADLSGTAMPAPAVLPNVIGVGASDIDDLRASFSNYGDSVDVVAPGTRGGNFVWTLDRTGEPGYVTDDYGAFSGTSAACPVAAGVVGLIASANPNLTEAQLRAVLLQTTDKIGGASYSITRPPYGTWHREYGHGRVNAANAVAAAISLSSEAEQRGRLHDILSVGPNPASDVVRIQGELGGAGTLRLMLSDATGRSLQLKTVEVTGAVDERLDVSSLPSGLYVVNASYGETRGQWKLIKR